MASAGDSRVGAAGAAVAPAVRVIAGAPLLLELGQVLRAKVLELSAGGVLLELAGRRVRATTELPLQAGTTYDFVVLMREPRIVLTPASALALPSAEQALSGGQLGPPLAALARAIDAQLTAADGSLRWIGELARRWDAGRITAPDLVEYYRRLGHDQEVAVLRLPPRGPAPADEVERLQGTLKAQALQVLGSGRGEQPAVEPAWARTIAASLHRLETENAHRADRGGPQVLSLPFGADGAFADARLFVAPPDDRDARTGERGAARPFTVVLLLALTRLGRLRIDVELTGADLDLRFEAEQLATLEAVRAGSAQLESALAEAGLCVRRLALRHAGEDGLRVADLAAPPVHGAGQAVDVHV